MFLGFLLFIRDSFIRNIGSRVKLFIKEFIFCLERWVICKFNKIINIRGVVGFVLMNVIVSKREDLGERVVF